MTQSLDSNLWADVGLLSWRQFESLGHWRVSLFVRRGRVEAGDNRKTLALWWTVLETQSLPRWIPGGWQEEA